MLAVPSMRAAMSYDERSDGRTPFQLVHIGQRAIGALALATFAVVCAHEAIRDRSR